MRFAVTPPVKRVTRWAGLRIRHLPQMLLGDADMTLDPLAPCRGGTVVRRSMLHLLGINA